MPLSYGKKFLAIPGPTTVPDEVLQAMHRPAIDIYGGDLGEIVESILADLRTLFRSKDADSYIYVANGHGGWEAALSNTLSRGDRVVALESGVFAPGWAEMAAVMGCEADVLPGPPRAAIDPAAVEELLREDRGHTIQAILCVHIDTASGVVNDIAAIRRAIDAAGHPALLMVDAVASAGCAPFEMDAWGVDLALTGSQKGLMSPPGLALIAARPKAKARLKSADLRTRYWDWEWRDTDVLWHKFAGTPPLHSLFALHRALGMLLREEGLENAWTRHRLLAAATRAAVTEWAKGGAVEFNILAPEERSGTVTMLRVNEGYDAARLRAFTAEHCGVTLGTTLGEIAGPGGGFRIAHMGHANAPSMLGVLGVTELAMQALGWPGAEGGVSAAVKALSGAAEVRAAR